MKKLNIEMQSGSANIGNRRVSQFKSVKSKNVAILFCRLTII